MNTAAKFWFPIISFAAAIFLLAAHAFRARTQPAGPTELKRSVVVELFTSEGCSSCPPADELLGTLRREANVNGAEVIPLGFHVDYWDHQGWRDRFDAPAFTRRQQDYAIRFGIEGPYTPQMVVNGAVEFVGSSANRATETIRGAGAQSEGAKIELSSAAGKLAVKISGATDGDVMLALTEDNLSTKVGGGENGGRTLHHSAVVREFRRIGEIKNGAFSGTVPVPMAAEWKPDDMRIVVFVQQHDLGKIAGAASRPLNALITLN